MSILGTVCFIVLSGCGSDGAESDPAAAQAQSANTTNQAPANADMASVYADRPVSPVADASMGYTDPNQPVVMDQPSAQQNAGGMSPPSQSSTPESSTPSPAATQPVALAPPPPAAETPPTAARPAEEEASIPVEMASPVQSTAPPVLAAGPPASPPAEPVYAAPATAAPAAPDKSFDYDRAAARYVSAFGNDSNDGLTAANAWRRISTAAKRAQPGTTIFVQAGLYQGEQLSFDNNGTAEKPIRVVGYTSSPGDRHVLKSSSYPIGMNASSLPLLDGGNRSSGMAVNLNDRQYIEIRNLQIRNYEIGVYGANTSHALVDNVFVAQIGNVQAEYSGVAVKLGLGSNYNRISNSVVGNSASEGIMALGNYNEIIGCLVYSDDNSTGYRSALDYYIMTGGSHNRIAENTIHRIGNLGHGGHGIGSKTREGSGVPSEHNVFEDNLAVNFSGSSFYVRHRDSRNNTFRRNTAREGDGAGFVAMDGAHDNLIQNHLIENKGHGISFYDSDEEGQSTAGNFNRFVDVKMKNITYAAIVFSNYMYPQSSSTGNRFERLNIDGSRFLFHVYHRAVDNLIIDSDIRNVQYLAHYNYGKSSSDLGVRFQGNRYASNGFPAP